MSRRRNRQSLPTLADYDGTSYPSSQGLSPSQSSSYRPDAARSESSRPQVVSSEHVDSYGWQVVPEEISTPAPSTPASSSAPSTRSSRPAPPAPSSASSSATPALVRPTPAANPSSAPSQQQVRNSRELLKEEYRDFAGTLTVDFKEHSPLKPEELMY
jgi:hypothetical protein